MQDNLQAATGFQILLLFTVVLMCLNPSGGEGGGAHCLSSRGFSCHTPWCVERGTSPWSHYRSQEIGSGAAVSGG